MLITKFINNRFLGVVMAVAIAGLVTLFESTPAMADTGTTIPPATQIVDSQGKTYTVVNGQIAQNGAIDPRTAQVSLLLYYNGLIYQQATAKNLWWSTNGAGWPNATWTQVSGDPRPPCIVSPNGTTIPPASQILDSFGRNYTVVNGQIAQNGTIDTRTAQVSLLLFYNGLIYQQATSQNLWWSTNGTGWPNATWTQVSGDPRPANSPSPNGTTIPPVSKIVDNQGKAYTVVNGQIAQNGTIDTRTAQVSLLLFYNGLIYQQATSQNLWWSTNGAGWPNATWTQISGDPRPACTGSGTVSPSGTTIPPASQIIDSQGKAYTVVNGQIAQSGTVDPRTAQVSLLLYYNGLIYQQATSQNLWWSTNGVGWPNATWTQVSGDPRAGITPPPQASAAGYTKLAFDDEFNGTSLDSSKWYRQRPFGMSDLNSSYINVANGVLTISGDGQGPNYSIGSSGPGMTGFSSTGGSYFEARMKFDPHGFSSGNGGWPSFWTMSAEHLWQGFQGRYLEIDWEYFGGDFGTPWNYGAGTAHDWIGSSDNQSSTHGTTAAGDGNWHTYGWLFKPGVSITWYLDGNVIGTTQIQPGGPYSGGDTQHLPIILGTATNWPIQIDWVRVWTY
jgi:hypothetical protein